VVEIDPLRSGMPAKRVALARFAGAGRGMQAGDKYIDEGTRFVAEFNDDGTGERIELSIQDPRIAGEATDPLANQADVLVNASHAASAVGTIKMDRPE
jgi:secreted PhoX family phosphatase